MKSVDRQGSGAVAQERCSHLICNDKTDREPPAEGEPHHAGDPRVKAPECGHRTFVVVAPDTRRSPSLSILRRKPKYDLKIGLIGRELGGWIGF